MCEQVTNERLDALRGEGPGILAYIQRERIPLWAIRRFLAADGWYPSEKVVDGIPATVWMRDADELVIPVVYNYWEVAPVRMLFAMSVVRIAYCDRRKRTEREILEEIRSGIPANEEKQ